jgi:hypothetical protein
MASCAVPPCGATELYDKKRGLCKPHYMIDWRRRNRSHHDEYMRRYGRRHRYGLTSEEFDALREGQHGACAICSRPFRGTRDCNVDHDHETGKVRGLLCHDCNTGIGSLGDDVRRLELAIAYLKEAEGG